MASTIIKIILGVLLIIIGIYTIIIVVKNKDVNKIMSKMTIIGTCVEIITGAIALFSISPTVVKVIVPEQEKLYNQVQKAEKKNSELKEMVVAKDKQLEKQEEKLKSLSESLKDNAEFLDYRLYIDDDEITINNTNSIANINEKIYFSSDVFETSLNSKMKEDEENKLIYFGKYPESTESLLSVCKYYDSDVDYFKTGKEESYEVRGKSYTDGFCLEIYSDDIKKVSFNLEGKYSELMFRVGHVDNTNDASIIVKPYLDDKPGEEIVFDTNTDPDVINRIPLNKAKELRLEWYGNRDRFNSKYGFMDVKVK